MVISSPNIIVTTRDKPSLPRAMNREVEELQTWLYVIKNDFRSVYDNGTWTLDANPSNMPLPTNVVLKIKRDLEANIERIGVRIFVEENHNIFGQIYSKTYVSIVKLSITHLQVS